MSLFGTVGLGDVSVSDGTSEWTAWYTYSSTKEVAQLGVRARGSDLDVLVVQVYRAFEGRQYYISVPAAGVAIPGIGTLSDSFWITEKLAAGLGNEADARSIAVVLKEFGKHE